MPMPLMIDEAYDAIEASVDRTSPIQEQYEDNQRELCGRFMYEDDGKKRPLNLIARNMLTLTAHLAARCPRSEVIPKSVALRGSADTRSLLIDTASEELDRVKLSRLQLLRAGLGPMAITKVGARTGSDLIKVQGRLYDRGSLYIQGIDFSDHVADHQARCRDELTWEGHRYRIPRWIAMECGLFNPDVIARMPVLSEFTGGERRRNARPEMITKRNSTTGQEAVPMIELIDMCFYDDDEPLIVTLPSERGQAADYLRIEPWQGPTRGPYEWLEFHPQPNQLYGMPIVAFMREQHDATNELFSKMLDQILRSRRLLIGPRASSDDLDTARDSADGDVLEFDDPEHVKNVDIGGMQPDFEPFSEQLINWANLQYNFDIAAGQSGGTDKATIYQGQAANANALIDDLQSTLEEHESRVSTQMDWRLQQDPFLRKTMLRRLPGQEYIEVVYDAQARRDDFDKMTVKVRYGSMLRQDPQVKAANLIQLLNMAQASIQTTLGTGGAWNTVKALEFAGRWLGFDEIDELINDPMLQAELQRRMMQGTIPPPSSGQPGGMSQVNPKSTGAKMQPAPSKQNGRSFAQPKRQMAGAA